MQRCVANICRYERNLNGVLARDPSRGEAPGQYRYSVSIYPLTALRRARSVASGCDRPVQAASSHPRLPTGNALLSVS